MNKKKNYFRKILSYFLKYKKELSLIIIISLLTAAIGVIEPFISAREYTAITTVNIDEIIKYAIIIFFMKIISSFLFDIYSLIANRYFKKVSLNIQRDTTEELFKLETSNFDKLGTSFFTERAVNDTNNLVSSIGGLKHILMEIFSSIGIVVYLINASLKIFFLLLLFSIFLFFITKKRRDYYEKLYFKRRQSREYQSSSFTELIRGIRDVKVLNLRKTMTKKIISGQEKINDISYQEKKEGMYFDTIYTFMRCLITLIVILYSVHLVKSFELDGAALLIIFLYHDRVLSLNMAISRLYIECKDIKLNMKNIGDILDNSSYPKEKFGTLENKHFSGRIEFLHVNFGYDTGDVLKDVNFLIRPNDTIGIVGPSGAGKTTIFNLISKLYNVNSGEILIDGHNINEYTEETIRGNISVITQNPYIFNMTVKENIKIVNPDITDEEMIEKCKLAELHDYIETLPQKYDTMLGENGVILSGGLKQRLAIARALVKNSEIILLDEATSSLDNEVQEHVMSAIKNISKEYTILIIAHRLSTIKDCDKILVINDGTVSGYDTHDNLIKSNLIYKKLYKKELINE